MAHDVFLPNTLIQVMFKKKQKNKKTKKQKNKKMDKIVDCKKLSYGQMERLKFIDACLVFLGRVNHSHLIETFGIGSASCTRDFALYKSISTDNLYLKHSNKMYYAKSGLRPTFLTDCSEAIALIREHFSTGTFEEGVVLKNKYFEKPFCTNRLELGTLTQSIELGRAVNATYASYSTGLSQMSFVPHTIATVGTKYIVRAYNIESSEFRNFDFDRLRDIELLPQNIPEHASRTHDIEWKKKVEIELSVHSSISCAKAVEYEFGMDGGKLCIQTREALIDTVCQEWNIGGNFALKIDEKLTMTKRIELD